VAEVGLIRQAWAGARGRRDRAVNSAAKTPDSGGQWQTVLRRITGSPTGRPGQHRRLVNSMSPMVQPGPPRVRSSGQIRTLAVTQETTA